MISVMRKHHKVLMIVITGLVCISFSWYWNVNKIDFAQTGQGIVGRVYDRTVSQAELMRDKRLLRLAGELGMNDLVQSLVGQAQTETEMYDNFAWNLIVLRHEADALGIKPTTAEIANVVKTLPAFQGADGFDLTKYSQIVDRALGPNGFTEEQIEELAGNKIALERIKKLLDAGVTVPEAEMRHDYERLYSKMDVSVVRFSAADFANQAQVSDDEIKKYFEAHKAELKTEEKRKVKFVVFGLTEEQKKLTGKARIDALQKLADKANDFTDALEAPGANFEQVAAKFQLTPKETGEFTQVAPDPQLAAVPQLGQTAFSLTKENPNSNAIQATDGFYIVHLIPEKIEPARPLTLEEARPKIIETLKQQRSQGLMASKAAGTAQLMRDVIKSGKSPEEAATRAGVKAEKIPAFALLDRAPGAASAEEKPEAKKEDPEMPYIKQAVAELSPGEVSDFVRKPDGGLLVVLEKREPIDPSQYEKGRASMEENALRNKSEVVFEEWLRERRRAAGVEETKSQRVPG